MRTSARTANIGSSSSRSNFAPRLVEFFHQVAERYPE